MNLPAMQQVVRLGQRAARSNIPVLITGESGVGKELIARAIQGASERAEARDHRRDVLRSGHSRSGSAAGRNPRSADRSKAESESGGKGCC